MKYPKSERYDRKIVESKIMGPNPIKLEEELLNENQIPRGSCVMDLGSGTGLTSVFLVKEYGFRVTAADFWSDPAENRIFFQKMGLSDEQITPVKADANALPFKKDEFDAIVSVDSYNYFGRDPKYLDEKLLLFLKADGLIYISIPGMKKDCHEKIPPELLLSWSKEQLDYIHDINYWKCLISAAKGVDILSIHEMESNEEVWADWLNCENEYARGDRKTMEAGGGKYLNFIAIILRKKS